MTEAEWLGWSTDPQKMLEFLRRKASDRKLRLFAVACCRLLFRKVRVSPLYEQEVHVAERYADGAASSSELQEVRRYSNSLAEHACMNTTELEDGIVMADCAALNSAWAATIPGTIMPDDNGVSEGRLAAYQTIQCGLLRCIFANPFHPSPPVPPAVLAWNDRTVRRLAEAIYEDRKMPEGTLDTARLAILADALLDAGCEDEELLACCRSEGPHVRGCWAVDLILGKQ